MDYSWYSSTIGYSVTGGHKQDAHYIGIPVRADFTIARNRWLDVYIGAGASADFCIAAFEDGGRIAKDGVGFSLIGAGGVQFNITDNFGLWEYVRWWITSRVKGIMLVRNLSGV